MDDEAAKVDQHPPMVIPALDPERLGSIQDHQLLLHLFGDGPDLAGRIATRNHEIVGNRNNVASVLVRCHNALNSGSRTAKLANPTIDKTKARHSVTNSGTGRVTITDVLFRFLWKPK